MDIKNRLKLSLLFSFLTVLTAAVQAHSVEKDKMVSPSADFIELTEAYQNRIPNPAEKNGFVYLMGIMAPKNEDPMAYGQAAINWSNNKVANGGKNDSPKPDMCCQLGESYRALLQKTNCQMRASSACTLAKHQMLAREAIEHNQWLLKRWLKLVDFSDYQNTLKIDLIGLFLGATSDVRLQRLALMDLWLDRNNYPPEKIKQILQKDYDFHIRQAANATNLVEKTIAIAALRNHYYWINELLRSVDHHKAALINPDYLQRPIPSSALSLKGTYVGELQFFISLYKPHNINEDRIFAKVSDNDMQQLFNHKAAFLKRLTIISESADYQNQLNQLKDDKAVRQYIASFKAVIEDWDDTIGSADTDAFAILVTSVAIAINRTRQVVAIQKAVNILNAIRQQGIEKDAISEWLKQSKHYNPITQKPFIWDGDKKHLIIKTESDKDTYYLSL